MAKTVTRKPGVAIDMVGKKFGDFKVLERAGTPPPRGEGGDRLRDTRGGEEQCFNPRPHAEATVSFVVLARIVVSLENCLAPTSLHCASALRFRAGFALKLFCSSCNERAWFTGCTTNPCTVRANA